MEAEDREPPAGVFHGALGDIDSAQFCTGFRKALVVGSEPDADFEDALALPLLKTREALDVRLEAIARGRLVHVGRAREIELLTTGRTFPEVYNRLLVGSRNGFVSHHVVTSGLRVPKDS